MISQEARDRIVELRKDGLSQQEISSIVKVDRSTVVRYTKNVKMTDEQRYKMYIKNKKNIIINEPLRNQIRELRQQGLSYYQIRNITGINVGSISKHTRDVVLTEEQKFKLNKNNPAKSFDDNLKIEAIKLRKEHGLTFANIAKKLGASRASVSTWCREIEPIRNIVDPWTNEELEFLKNNYYLKGSKFCCNELNRGIRSVISKANILGLKTKYKNQYGPKEIVGIDQNGKIIAVCKKHGNTKHYKTKYNVLVCSVCCCSFSHKLENRLRGIISKCFKREYRYSNLWKLLPYNRRQLYKYLDNIKKLQDNRCPICHISYNERVLSIDHVIPLKRAKTKEEIISLFDLKNLNLMCRNCNSSKHTSNFNEWFEKKGKYLCQKNSMNL